MKLNAILLSSFACALAACAVAGLAGAAPSAPAVPMDATPAFPVTAPFWGPSGLGVMPTSTTVPSGTLQVSAGWEHITPKFGGDVNFLPTATGTWGFKNAEAGVGVLLESGRSISSSSSWDGSLYGKYRFYSDEKTDTSAALGVQYYKPEGNGSDTSVFVTGGTPLAGRQSQLAALRGEAGLILQFGNLTNANITQLRPMAGLDYNGTPQWTFAADLIPAAGGEPRLWTVLARYRSTGRLSAQVGYGQQFDADEKVVAAVAYSLGR